MGQEQPCAHLWRCIDIKPDGGAISRCLRCPAVLVSPAFDWPGRTAAKAAGAAPLDGEDLATVRVAELHAAGETAAMVGFVRQQLGAHPLGPFHPHGLVAAVVVRGDGRTIERDAVCPHAAPCATAVECVLMLRLGADIKKGY